MHTRLPAAGSRAMRRPGRHTTPRRSGGCTRKTRSTGRIPFRDPLHGVAGVIEYTRWAFSSEQDVEFWFGEPLADGNRATVEYWAVILQQDGAISTLAGTVWLRFDDDGRVSEHRDYWTLEDGRRPPYESWETSPRL